MLNRRKCLVALGTIGTALASSDLFAKPTLNNDEDGPLEMNQESIIREGVINVKLHGVIGDGKTDDTLALRKVFENLNNGSIVLFPPGTYLVTAGISILQSHITITGNNNASRIIYSYEQKEADTTFAASLFSFKSGVDDILVEKIRLEYKGSFFPKVGESYKGKVSGLLFMQCSNVLIRNVEVSGFNAHGIVVATGDPTIYAKHFKVHQCNLHRNRVSGVAFGYVNYISIIDCDLDFNGSELDGGTGYGCCGSSSEFPMNIQIKNNRAKNNYRKGIDLHAGVNALIEGNICHANRLYAIYCEGAKTGNIIIKNNIISGMSKEKIGIPSPYTWITGIDFGPASDSLVPDDYHNYIIEGNLFTDFGLNDLTLSAYPIHCYLNFKKGFIQIKNNIIRAGRIKHLIGFGSQVNNSSRDVSVEISGNQASVDDVTGDAIKLDQCTRINISNNQFTFQNVRGALIDFSSKAADTVTYIGNQVSAENLKTLHALKHHKELSETKKLLSMANFLNGKQEP